MASNIASNSPLFKDFISKQDNNKKVENSSENKPVQSAVVIPKEPVITDKFQKNYNPVNLEKLRKDELKQHAKKTLITNFSTLAISVISLCIAIPFLQKALNKGNTKEAVAIWQNIANEPKLKDMALPESLRKFVGKILKGISDEEIAQKGGKTVNSILLYGPAGTGKTTFAKAIAKEFPDSRFAVLDVTKLSSEYVGRTEKNINQAIEEICRVAQQNPKQKIFVFIDEIDSVMMVDNGHGAKYSNDVLNEFKRSFTEQLGKQKNVITIGATNLPVVDDGNFFAKHLDKAMLDRFQQKILVDLPTKDQIKEAMIKHYKNCSLVEDTLKNANEKLDVIAEFLEGKISFRTLESLYSSAAFGATNKKVQIQDILFAIQENIELPQEEFQQLVKKLSL